MRLSLLTLLTLCVRLCQGAPGNDTLTIEKALTRYTLGYPLLSPDGTKAIIPVTQIASGPDGNTTHLWLLDVATKNLRQFTSSAKSELNPKWSPDGQKLAFT